MDSKTKAGIISVVLAIIGLVGGGAAYNIQVGDNFSNSDSSSTVIEGDNYFGGLGEDILRDIGADIALEIICEGDVIPPDYESRCAEWELEP